MIFGERYEIQEYLVDKTMANAWENLNNGL